MAYKSDDVVTTKDGKRHRVLWITERCAEGNPLRLRVKSLDDKHRKGYAIRCEQIAHHATRGK